VLFCLLPALLASVGRAADTVDSTIDLAATGETALDDALRESATLVQLHDSGKTSPATLIARARTDQDRLLDAMHSLGHYAASLRLTIADLTLDDPALPDTLDAWPEGKPVPVHIEPTPGPVFTLRNIVLNGDAAGQKLDLKPGQPAVAADVLAAGAHLLAALRKDGHALAKLDPPIADLDVVAEAVDVDFEVNAGPRVSIGAISVDGLSTLNESYIRRRLALKSGTIYSPTALESARADLAKVPIIASVRLAPAQEVAADGTLPVDVVLSERKPRAVSLSAAYSTDQGGNTTATWSHRNLFGNAEVLTVSAGLTDIGATAAKQPGYKLAGLLTLPDWRERDQSLDITALAVRESLDAYDRTAAIIGATFNRRLSEHWIASIGLFGEQAYFVQDEVGRAYDLLQVPMGLHYNTTTSLIDPATGTRVDTMVTPTESISHPNATFTIAQVSGAQFFDLSAPGRSVLALRGLVGTVQGASTFAIPPDQRFYGGGSGTIRGYRYQSVGPELSNGKPSGGNAMSAGTVEFRQRIGADWGGAFFIDAGQVSTTSTPFNGQFRAGAGVGVRYYTSIGPLRADVAVPLIHQNNSDPVEFYIGLGQAF